MFKAKNYKNITLQKSNVVAIITLNRPDKLNSFNVEMHEELHEAMDDIATDGESRALLLTAAGRGFCARQDLGDRAASSDSDKAPDLSSLVEKYYNPLIRRQTNLPMPVICAMNDAAAFMEKRKPSFRANDLTDILLKGDSK